jgi:DNA polymerase IV
MFVAEATILHADLDAFFASVEQRDDPGLRGRPVIVGAGVVLAASYEARAYGIETAMGGVRARRLCPHAIVVPPRMSAYAEASKAVYRVFDDTTPLVEGMSIDEAFLDVRGMERIAGSPVEIAEHLRRRVLDEVGLPLTVGVARTKFLAKVASGVAKPDGLLVVPPDRELAFLHPLPVERLWGVGPATAAKLREPTPSRAGPQPRSPAGSEGPPPTLDRVPARTRPLADAEVAARDRRCGRRARRPRHPADAARRAGRSHRRAAAAFRRLLTGNALAHAGPAD